jgi:hypothetical protein
MFAANQTVNKLRGLPCRSLSGMWSIDRLSTVSELSIGSVPFP